MTTLRRAMVKFGDLKSETDDLLSALHQVMEPIIPDESHRNQIFLPLQAAPTGAVGEAINAKRAADLYLGLVARKLWPAFLERARESANSTQPGGPAPEQPGAGGSGH